MDSPSGFLDDSAIPRRSSPTSTNLELCTILLKCKDSLMVVRLRLARFGQRVSFACSTTLYLINKPVTASGSSVFLAEVVLHLVFMKLGLLFAVQNLPFYRIFAADSRYPRDGKHLEIVGHYNPIPGKNDRSLA